jgi:hypothetical protein
MVNAGPGSVLSMTIGSIVSVSVGVNETLRKSMHAGPYEDDDGIYDKQKAVHRDMRYRLQ